MSDLFLHAKRGTVYQATATAVLQSSGGPITEGTELVIYRGADGKVWARPSHEFYDGRFQPLQIPERY